MATTTIPAIARKIDVLAKQNERVSRHTLTLLTLVGGPKLPADAHFSAVAAAFEAIEGVEVTIVQAIQSPKSIDRTKVQIKTIRERNAKAKAKIAAAREAKAAKAAAAK